MRTPAFWLSMGLLPLVLAACTAPPTYDLVLRNGTICDGSGAAPVTGDVAIKDGRIAAVGALPARFVAKTEIDARGKVIAPGFVDVHTHVDADIFNSPAAENFIRDGVTTIVSGNCGSSVVNVEDYLKRVQQRGAGPNVATLYGHNTVLRTIKGDRKGELTPVQLDLGRELVRKAMKDGAVGFSTGLIYNPGQFSSTEEIIELARPSGDAGGVYATHMRSEGGQILSAIDEAVRIGRESRARVQISHFKLPADTARKLGGADATLGRVQAARDSGLEVWLDQYPYTASSTSISTLLPKEFLEQGIDAARKRLTDSAEFDRTLAAMIEHHGKTLGKTSLAYVSIAQSAAFPHYNGRNLAEITRMRLNRDEGELLKDAPTTKPLSIVSDKQNDPNASPGSTRPAEPPLDQQCRTALEIFRAGNTSCVFHSMADPEVERIMQSPLVAIASDSGLRQFGVGVPHPRGYGTNSRVLGVYCRQKRLFPVQEAVRKMTSLPAQSFRLAGRGLLKPGYAADITIFDPQTVIDRATYANPHQYPEGITDVIVNGVPVLRGGVMSGALPGRPIYGPGHR